MELEHNKPLCSHTGVKKCLKMGWQPSPHLSWPLKNTILLFLALGCNAGVPFPISRGDSALRDSVGVMDNQVAVSEKMYKYLLNCTEGHYVSLDQLNKSALTPESHNRNSLEAPYVDELPNSVSVPAIQALILPHRRQHRREAQQPAHSSYVP